MTKTIGVKDSTYDHLDEAKATGQSFDGKILELLEKAGELPAEATTA